MKALLPLLLLLLGGCLAAPISRKALDGQLSLTDVDLCRERVVELGGQWDFHWQRFLTSADLPGLANQTPDVRMAVPSRWTGQKLSNGQVLPGQGFGTLVLRLKLPDTPCRNPLSGAAESLAIVFRGASLAFEVEAFRPDGTRLAEPVAVGRIGTSRETSVGMDKGAVLALPWASEVVLFWRVSNFQHRDGGPWESVSIGARPVLDRLLKREILFDCVAFGAVASLGIYLLFVSLMVRGRAAVLWLAVFCFTVAVRPIVPTGYVAELIPSQHAWGHIHRIELLGVYLAILSFYCFLRTQYRFRWRKLWDVLIIPLHAVFSIVTLVGPFEWYYGFLPAAHVCAVLLVLLAVSGVARAVLRTRSRSAWLVAFGTFALGVSVVLEILTQRNVIYMPGSVTRGLLLFVICEAVSLVIEMQRGRSRVERLAGELHRSAESLRDRNAELTRTNGELELTRARLETVLHATRLMSFATDSLRVSEVAISAMVQEICKTKMGRLDLWLPDAEGTGWRHFTHHRTVISISAPLRFREVSFEAPPSPPSAVYQEQETLFGRRSCVAKTWLDDDSIFLFVGVQREALAVLRLRFAAEGGAPSAEGIRVVETLGISLASALTNLRLIEQEKESLLRLVSLSASISDRLNSPIMAASNATDSLRRMLETGDRSETMLAQFEKIVGHLASSVASLIVISRELEELREHGNGIEPTSTLARRFSEPRHS